MDRATTQRLWGAAVLIAIAVIFMPMLVKAPAPDSGVRDVPLDVPAAPNAPQSNVQELPLGEPGAIPANGAVGFDAPADGEVTAPVATSPAVASGDYAINFGSYASNSDAQKVIAALAKAGLKARSEVATANGKTAYRVRIGNYPTREAAEAARIDAARVNPAVKADVVALNASPAAPASASVSTAPEPVAVAPKPKPEVVRPAVAEAAPVAKPEVVKPAVAEAAPVAKPSPAPAAPVAVEKPKPVEKPAAANTGFAVQLGAFANAEEATKLRDRARAAGFSATTESVKTDKGTLTRVKLGPVTSRQSADAMRASAQSKLGVAGVVRTQP